MNKRNLAVALGVAALAVPAAAAATPVERPAVEEHAKGKKDRKPKRVMFVFKGTFTAPGSVEVLSGNAHVRRGGYVGEVVTFDLEAARFVVADTNGDAKADAADVKDGDRVLVQARIARRTKYDAATTVVARKLIDRSSPPVEDDAEETLPAS